MNAPAAPARVHSLDVTLANQIAAGEVVERPSSVLKELLENAIDAGATRIDVHAERGGISALRVSDDGVGIHHDDLHLALQRHATSKIATLEQLEAVTSMGFRGEALPSIASVSRLQITSRMRGDESAWQISAEGGPADALPVPASHPPGTTVAMRELFFNTPVRRRFLRAPRTELRHLDRVFRRIALGAFPVAMSLTHDGKELLRVAGALDEPARRRRVARLIGDRFAASAQRVERESVGLRIRGWIGAPGMARDRHDQQHLYVNGRAVVDSTVRHAVRLAYGESIADTQHPAWLLWLEMDPREVDVNVHPAKQEVRFREARMVHDFVRAGVREAVLEAVADRVCAVSGADPAAAADALVPARPPTGTAPKPQTSPSRTAQRMRESPLQPALRVLAVLADGLVVARRDEQLLIVHSAQLLQMWVRTSLSAIASGECAAISRPLLLPQRLAPGARLADDDRAMQALESLGFSVRPSGENSALLLAVPECLSRVPVSAWQGVFAQAPHPRAATDWVATLAEVAGAQVLTNATEVAALLAQLGDLDDEAAPWMVLDAERAAGLLRSPKATP